MAARFREMNLDGATVARLESLKFVEATPIQEAALPKLMEGKNVVGQAQTGSGKTLAFAIPILQKMNPHHKYPQALILAPTRELVMQISEVFWNVRSENSEVRIVPIYGGAPKENQKSSLRRGCQILVATPGRLIDFIWEGEIKLDHIKILILDEADRMLEMGFIEDVQFVLSAVPKNLQIGLFSATLSSEIKKIIVAHVPHPSYIQLEHHAADKPKIQQTCYGVESHQKLKTLLRVIDDNRGSTLIFCRTRGGADRLADKLSRSGHRVGIIHGGKTQGQRDSVIRGFRKGEPLILVATDIASRGLDIHGVSQVVNYDVPVEPEDYLHRIGRTGRAGREGTGVMFVTSMEGEQLQRIERLLGEPLAFAEEAPRPKMHSGNFSKPRPNRPQRQDRHKNFRHPRSSKSR